MQLPITIVNRKDTKEGEYVGRPTPLGNPWTISEDLPRDECIKKYKSWLNIQWRTHNWRVKDELLRLTNKLLKDGELTLSCWCAPEACHAEVIAAAIKAIAEKDLA